MNEKHTYDASAIVKMLYDKAKFPKDAWSQLNDTMVDNLSKFIQSNSSLKKYLKDDRREARQKLLFNNIEFVSYTKVMASPNVHMTLKDLMVAHLTYGHSGDIGKPYVLRDHLAIYFRLDPLATLYYSYIDDISMIVCDDVQLIGITKGASIDRLSVGLTSFRFYLRHHVLKLPKLKSEDVASMPSYDDVYVWADTSFRTALGGFVPETRVVAKSSKSKAGTPSEDEQRRIDLLNKSFSNHTSYIMILPPFADEASKGSHVLTQGKPPEKKPNDGSHDQDNKGQTDSGTGAGKSDDDKSPKPGDKKQPGDGKGSKYKDGQKNPLPIDKTLPGKNNNHFLNKKGPFNLPKAPFSELTGLLFSILKWFFGFGDDTTKTFYWILAIIGAMFLLDTIMNQKETKVIITEAASVKGDKQDPSFENESLRDHHKRIAEQFLPLVSHKG